jgi:outer membrane protein, heavy metal efflux system
MKIRWIGAPLLVCFGMVVIAQPPVPQPLAPKISASPGDWLHLDDVIRLALERNPDAASAEHTIRVMEHRVSQARALPDPMVSFGWAGKLAPFDTMSGDASSYRGITVSEQFPYPGKRRLQTEIARRDVDASRADCEAARRRIVLDVKTAYAEYFYLDKAIGATQQNKELLEKLANVTEAQYRVGKAMQQDVLRAQIEISLLMEKLTQLETRRDEAVAALNAALVESPEKPLPPPQAILLQPQRYSLDQLYALAEQNDMQIVHNRASVERGKLSVSLAERQYRPDIGVSYMFQQRTDQSDMHGVMVSVNVPVFWKSKQREAVAEAAEALHGAEKMQESRRNEVRAEVRQEYLAAESAGRLLTLYAKGIVPQSSLALESAMSEYQVGKLDFLSLISDFTSLLDYETNSYRQLADRQIAIAQIENLTGEPVTTDAAPDSPAEKTSQEGGR